MAAKQSKAKKCRRSHDKDTGIFAFTFLTITSFPATHVLICSSNFENDECLPASPPKLFDTRSPLRYEAYESWDILAATIKGLLPQRLAVSTMNLKMKVFVEETPSFIEAPWQPFTRTNRSPPSPLSIVEMVYIYLLTQLFGFFFDEVLIDPF